MSAVDSLAAELKQRYAGAQDRQKVVQIHLFGIEHAEVLKSLSITALLDRAGMKPSYGTEVRKGMRLADHVSIRK